MKTINFISHYFSSVGQSPVYSGFVFSLLLVLFLAAGPKSVSAQDSPSTLYIPLIGITLVPDPLVLPAGAGPVKYNYAVKNFLKEASLSDVSVSDNNCSPVKFSQGDDNGDKKLDYSETWRYTCTSNLTKTTQSTAIATGTANNITATHNAYATVVVGGKDPPPLVSIVNVTKIAYPLSLPVGGGDITYTYKVNNPGVVPLSAVKVTDNKCSSMSSKLGDTNNNNLLDTSEVWIYTCVVNLKETTTNTVTVEATSNGSKASDNATVTVKVDIPGGPASQANPNLPNAGNAPDMKMTIWEIMLGILVFMVIFLVIKSKNNLGGSRKRAKYYGKR